MRRSLRLTTLLLTLATSVFASAAQGRSIALGSPVSSAATVPTFALSVPPGGREDGKDISAHWFTVPGSRFRTGTDRWIVGSYFFPATMPVVRDWAVVWNFHTVGGDIGWPVGVSPVRVDITNGFLHVLTHGAGTLGIADGIEQPVSTTKLSFPKSCQLALRRDRWSDWVMHVKFDSRHGYVKLWQDGMLIVNANNIPTAYTAERFVELWVGFYTNGASNPGQTFSMRLTLPRIGTTYQKAVQNVPPAATQWGSLEFDPSVVDKLPPRPPNAFVYPQTLGGRAKCVTN